MRKRSDCFLLSVTYFLNADKIIIKQNYQNLLHMDVNGNRRLTLVETEQTVHDTIRFPISVKFKSSIKPSSCQPVVIKNTWLYQHQQWSCVVFLLWLSFPSYATQASSKPQGFISFFQTSVAVISCFHHSVLSFHPSNLRGSSADGSWNLLTALWRYTKTCNKCHTAFLSHLRNNVRFSICLLGALRYSICVSLSSGKLFSVPSASLALRLRQFHIWTTKKWGMSPKRRTPQNSEWMKEWMKDYLGREYLEHKWFFLPCFYPIQCHPNSWAETFWSTTVR